MPLSRQLLVAILALVATLPGVAQVIEDDRNIDPWEPFNRRVFAFNEAADRFVLNPVARGYRAVTPDPVERSISNFIANIYEFNTILNSLLQGRVADTVHSSGRFVVNSTIGIGGIFDVASRLGVERRPADFGQTLAVWGLPQGPFVVVPILGPRTVRSGSGQFVDALATIPAQLNDEMFNWGFIAAEAIDVRAQLLKGDELITGDRYIFQRTAYLQYRARFVSGGEIEDNFSDYEEGEEFEDF